MHLMPHTTLLAASLQYGVVSRSYPLSGKVLRGFLDASGTLNGLGIGNPNAEFSPHVSSIALASEGGTAKVLWGFRNGEVAVTTALRAMDHNRTSAARLVRCRPEDCHEGPVECVAWATGGEGCVLFISGGVDGRVKLWEAKASLNCLWTSNNASLLPDPCVKVVMDVRRGAICAGLRSGSILVWTGFSGLSAEALDAATLEPQELRVHPPAIPPSLTGTPAHERSTQELTEMHIVPQGEHLSLLAAYHPSPVFHRLSWNAASNAFDRTLFGEEDAAPIRSILPVWATRQGEGDFVIAGDQLGNVSIFPWHAQQSPRPTPSLSSVVGTATVPAARRFVAHDGAVTALAWNSAVLVSGSNRGTVKAWDALTFAPLRTFASPSSRPLAGGEWDPVSQILLERDAVVVSVGNKVLAWKAGPVGKNVGHGKGKVRATGGRSSHGVAKWQQQIEMYRDIAESQRELAEEQKHTRRKFGQEKDQLSTLAHLGLSEVEAVEYVLMLSRDEEQARRESAAERSRHDFGEEGVFLADFDDVPTPMATPSNPFGSASSSVVTSRTSSFSAHSSPSPPSGSYTNGMHVGQSFPRAAPSSSNHKVQVSPRAHPEPMEAGSSTSASPLPSRSANSSVGIVSTSTYDPEQFPAVSRTPSSASGSSVRDSAPGSPQSVRSAWSTPLRSLHSSGAPSPSRVGGIVSPSQSPSRSMSGALGSARRAAPPVSYAEEDEDLRFAIELSLAEARSRGENV
ncbi:hypothetical protein K466DRAFT_502600 [Polyporus arcularius HHB13444]|uniref:Uncharacterized protein n=1 Tax=Polyporus arcularius HHB13444 TaxID=1314778 RepID=A0A5C3NV58_9APHY|nr:hypothetical protein K466DRAFT_502600 [Polyporus arcularius HHB13444]